MRGVEWKYKNGEIGQKRHQSGCNGNKHTEGQFSCGTRHKEWNP